MLKKLGTKLGIRVNDGGELPLPVAAMRGRRVYVMDHWLDIVQGDYPPSAYRVEARDIRSTSMLTMILR